MNNLSGNTRVWLLASLLLNLPSLTVSQNLDVRGQASVAIGINDSAAFTFRSSLRYIPSLFVNVPVAETQTLDGELAANLFGSVNIPKKQRPATDLSLDLYRAWVRYAAPQLEVRAGLQKISFGSATLFRPLMWFDSIDPRDPLQITGGVYALLGRFFFMSTANIWLWGIYGRDELKGWETIPTKQGSLEFGGRLQMPVLTGEAAVTYHHRTTQLSFTPPGVPVPDQQTMTFPEDRAGFDGKWDVGPGIWIESAVVRQNTEAVPYRWQQALTLGTDYTFSVGQGLTAMAEYFLQSYTATLFGAGPTAQLAGLSVSYPLGILDNVSGIFFYDLRNSDPYVYLDWRRTYDNWLFNLILFANPDQPGFVAGLQQSLSLAGKGFVFLVVFNH
jgi:hypothetical protein